MTKITDMEFLVSNSGIFIILRNFAISQIWGCWFQIKWYYFQIPAQKIHKWGIFGPEFKDFYFCVKRNVKKNSKTLASNMTRIFSNFSPKIRKSGIFGPKLAIRQIRGRWLQIWQWLFEIAAQNTQITHLELNANRSFLVPSLFFFRFGWKFIVSQIRGYWLKVS